MKSVSAVIICFLFEVALIGGIVQDSNSSQAAFLMSEASSQVEQTILPTFVESRTDPFTSAQATLTTGRNELTSTSSSIPKPATLSIIDSESTSFSFIISPTPTLSPAPATLASISESPPLFQTPPPFDTTNFFNNNDRPNSSSGNKHIVSTVVFVALIVGFATIFTVASVVAYNMMGGCRQWKVETRDQKEKRKPVGSDHFVIANEEASTEAFTEGIEHRSPKSFRNSTSAPSGLKAQDAMMQRRRCSTVPKGYKATVYSNKVEVEVYELSHSIEDSDGEESGSEASGNSLEDSADESGRKRSLTKQLSMGKIGYAELSEQYFQTLERVKNGVTIEEAVYFVPSGDEKNIVEEIKGSMTKFIPQKHLKVIEATDSRGYGVGICKSSEGRISVGVKTQVQDDEKGHIKLLQEAAIMGQFSHPNILRLLGVTLAKKEVTLVLEPAPNNNLKEILHEMSLEDLSQLLPGTGDILLGYSQQICFGMHYLSSKGFVHGHLRAQNIFLTVNQVLKIAHFEICQSEPQISEFVPDEGVKWDAPEVPLGQFSTSSDIWSYACVLYEIWSIGKTPFDQLSEKQAVELVRRGHRLPAPHACPRTIYKWMIKCWHPDASSRPRFSDIIVAIMKKDTALTKYFETHIHESGGKELYADLQNMYLNLGPLKSGLALNQD